MHLVFDPRDFLILARELCAEERGEARLRTAIGRAYYASMLLARAATGVRERRHVHQAVQTELKRLPAGAPLSQKLGDLERLRGFADYDIVPESPLDRDWERNWSRAELLAQDIVTKLDSMRST